MVVLGAQFVEKKNRLDIMKEEVCSKELKLSKTKKIANQVEPYVLKALGSKGIFFNKWYINYYNDYVAINVNYPLKIKTSYINLDGTIKVKDKRLYEQLKKFGQLYGYDKLIKCWRGVGDE